MKKIIIIIFVLVSLKGIGQSHVVPTQYSNGAFGKKLTLNSMVAASPLTVTTGGGTDTIKCTTCYTGSLAIPYQQVVYGNSAGTGMQSDTALLRDTLDNTLTLKMRFPGTVTNSAGSSTVTGTNTRFFSTFRKGYSIKIGSETKTVSTITNNTSLTTVTTFTNANTNAAYTTGSATAPSLVLNGNGTMSYNGGVALSFNNTGVVLGNLAGGSLAAQNVSIGELAGQNVSGIGNVIIGYDAGSFASNSGAANVYVGNTSGNRATSGSSNTGLGSASLLNTSTGGSNVAIGAQTLPSVTTQSNNTALGTNAARFQVDGVTGLTPANGIYIGKDTKGGVTAPTNEMVIGYSAIGNGSNTTTLGYTSTTQANLYGDIQSPVLPPSAPTLSGSSSGGSIAAGTYFYRLTAMDAAGNTSFYGTQSSSVVTTGSTSSVTLTFPTLPAGASAWNIYRTTVSGTYGASTLIASNQTGATYVDVAAATTTGTPATITTAFLNKLSAVSGGDSWINNGGGVGIGTNAPSAKAVLELKSTTKGLLLPRMTKTQRDAISSPPAGLAIYQTDNTPGLRVYNGTNWMKYTETTD